MLTNQRLSAATRATLRPFLADRCGPLGDLPEKIKARLSRLGPWPSIGRQMI